MIVLFYLIMVPITFFITFIVSGVIGVLDDENIENGNFISGQLILSTLCAIGWPCTIIIFGCMGVLYASKKTYVNLITSIAKIIKGSFL
jgi:hypothetical protein